MAKVSVNVEASFCSRRRRMRRFATLRPILLCCGRVAFRATKHNVLTVINRYLIVLLIKTEYI